MPSRSPGQEGHAEIRRTLIRKRRIDGGAGRNAGFTISAMALAGILLVLSCGDGTTEPPAPDPLVPTAVAVSPATATVVEGDSLRLTATATNVYGQVVSGVEFEWASGNTAVAVVDTTGLVTGVGTGEVQVTATAAGVTGRAELAVVAPLPTTIAVTPDTVVLSWVGQTAQLTAEVLDQGGRVMDGIPVTWLSAETTVATIDASGSLTAVGNGVVTVTATAGEASGDAHVTVAINLERAALVALYNATDGPNWVDNTNWLTDAPLGEWYGVSTDGAGRVVRLDLAGRWDNETRQFVRHGLSGAIPPGLGNLANLRLLDLEVNDLSGAIPPELGNLANLERLSLQGNDLTGAIPPELGNLANLTRLYLNVNDLTGEIPPVLGNLANLEWLFLHTNGLTGAIPPELGNLANLEFLYLHTNGLTGAIPPELGNLANNLRALELEGNGLTGAIPPELGNLANLRGLRLHRNALSGAIPTELGNLAELRELYLGSNDLSGPIPLGFLQLDRLSRFYIRGNEGLCVPGTSAFVAWLENIEHRDGSGTLCNESDWKALESLFASAGGSGWTNTDGWVSGPALEEWHGVRADSLGHVTELDLEGNGLAGRLSAALGNLPRMTVLRIADNADLSGRLPLSLAGLSLQALHYSGTGLCVPDDTHFLDWLSSVRSHEGTGAECPPLSDREVLEIFYEATGGPQWTRSDNWLTDAPLRDWYGVGVDGEGRVSSLAHYRNNLTGSIPPELGDLAYLRNLNLIDNDLAGSIPPELGDLAYLRNLNLIDNDLAGSIPPELGDLANLANLYLSGNGLTGRIPPALGDLTNLDYLWLSENELTGPIPSRLGGLANLQLLALSANGLTGLIPPELGNLANLVWLYLGRNELTGSLPPEIGGLTRLQILALQANPDMRGALPASLTNLGSLEILEASGTQLCARSDPSFRKWLDRLASPRVVLCEGQPPASAYLVQAVQSRDFPVPLVAGEEALLRVFVTAGRDNSESLPPVRASFHLNGALVHVADIPAGGGPIPTEVDESSLLKSANAVIPPEVV